MFLGILSFTILLAALATGINGIPGSELDFSWSCHNMTWACHDLETCFQCGKLVNCVEVWKQIRAPKDNNKACGMCNSVVRQAKQKLLTDESQNLKDIFEASCKFQTTEALRDKCYRIIDEFGPELAKVLSSDVHCNTLCTLAGLCNKGNALQLIREQYVVSAPLLVPPHQKVNCRNCKLNAISDPKMVNSSHQDEFVKVLSLACASHFGENVGRCEEIVTKMGPVFYDVIKFMTEAERVGDSLKCEGCQFVVKHLKVILESCSTKDKCEEVLEGACGYLGVLSTQCKNFVDDYFDQVYDFLLDHLDPLQVCKRLNFCENEHPLLNPVRAIPLVSSYLMYTSVLAVRIEPLYNRVNERKKDVETDTFAEIVMDQNSNDFVTCEICKQVMEYLEQELGDNRTEEAIREALDKVCNVLPRHWRSKCTDFVDSHVDMIVELLEQAADPSTICKTLGVCLTKTENQEGASHGTQNKNKDNKLPETTKHRLQLPVKQFETSLDGTVSCKVCKTLISFVERELKDERVEDDIRNALDEGCKIFPKDMERQCQEFVDKNVDTLVSLIIQESSPNAICSIFKACSADSSSKSKDILTCELCKLVMKFLEKELGNNRTEEAIRKALDKVCNVLPKHWRGKCTDFVDKYADLIVDLLIKEVAPSAVCKALAVCFLEPESYRQLFHWRRTRLEKTRF